MPTGEGYHEIICCNGRNGLRAHAYVTPVAKAQVTLPPVQVIGNPCAYVSACIFPGGMNSFLVPVQPVMPPIYASIPLGDDGNPLIATCSSMREKAPIGCDVDDPPSAPGIPSPTRGQWQSNGCGAGGWFEKIGSHIVFSGTAGYTGNLDEPLVGFSFTSACAHHDQCYYVGFKSLCDLRFAGALADECQAIRTCGDIAAKYEEAVLLVGQDAYDNDHRDQECAKISRALREGDCAS